MEKADQKSATCNLNYFPPLFVVMYLLIIVAIDEFHLQILQYG